MGWSLFFKLDFEVLMKINLKGNVNKGAARLNVETIIIISMSF